MRSTVPFTATLLSLAGITASSCRNNIAERPNFIIIQFDDLGWDDLGINGNMIIETPAIDSLAKMSAQFSNFYVNPVSAPTRASMLTGRFFLRTGVSHVHGGKDYLSLNETTIADVMKENGYATGMWGKWHCGKGERYFPWQRGFDEAYMADLYQHRNSRGLLNGDSVKTNKWSDELIVDYTIDFINRCGDKPFFAYLSLLSCHSPLDAPDTFIRKYQKKGLSKNLSTLYAMIDHSDSQIKRLLKNIHDMHLDENTIIIFLSDNGPAINTGILDENDRHIRYVNKYKGHKGDIWENGVKSPLFICWKGKTEPATINELTDITDVFPTILEFAGIDYHSSTVMDGVSFAPCLTGKKRPEKTTFNYANPGWPPTSATYNPEGTMDEYQPVKKDTLNWQTEIISIRNSRYKLMLNPGTTDQQTIIKSCVLIDIIDDPKESLNIAEQNPDIVNRLLDSLHKWFDNIILEKSSFTMPEHYIGKDTGKTYLIPAITAHQISPGLKNTVHMLKNWRCESDSAVYKIYIEESGLYEIYLESTKKESCTPVMAVQIGIHTISTRLDGGKKQILGKTMIEKGNYSLILKMIQNETRSDIEFRSINLKRVKQ